MVILMKIEDGDSDEDRGDLLAHDGDAAGVPAEGRDVPLHPLEAGNLE